MSSKEEGPGVAMEMKILPPINTGPVVAQTKRADNSCLTFVANFGVIVLTILNILTLVGANGFNGFFKNLCVVFTNTCRRSLQRSTDLVANPQMFSSCGIFRAELER